MTDQPVAIRRAPHSVAYGGPSRGDDVPALARALAAELDGEVRFDAGSRALYATDASNYRQVPVGVVVPRTVDDLVAAVDVARRHQVPVLSRGGGTSLAGQCCNDALVLDTKKHLGAIRWVDPDRRLASVEPGCVLDDLRTRVEQDHGLTFGPDPSTHNRCTIGGMVGNDACGIHAQMAGRTADNVERLEVLTYRGLRLDVGPTSEDEWDRIVDEGGERGRLYAELRDFRDRWADRIRARFPDIPREVSGYNLPALLPEHGGNIARALVGSEGTCVTILNATLNLVPHRGERVLVVLGFDSVAEAADAVPDVVPHGPIGLEGLDRKLVQNMKLKGLDTDKLSLLPDGDAWLLVQFGADDRNEAEAAARDFVHAFDGAKDATVFDDDAQEEQLWTIREDGLGATAFVPGEPDRWPGWEDAAVPPDQLGHYLRRFEDLLDGHGYTASLYGHFGQGCVHCRIDFDLTTADGIDNWKRFLDEAADLVVAHGGSLSGEHGDGQARAALLGKMFGDDLLQAFREFKAIWDPDGRMNPGKVVDPYPVDANLRLGPDYAPAAVDPTFAYPADGGSFDRAALRCVGVGKCQKEDAGTMCPSYMVTREEAHSTRGRARLLFELLNGDVVDGWRDQSVADALDLCLACKACKSECPVNVDMATYKAEFLSHHYKGRLRPRPAYAMGLIPVWARVARHVPGLANATLHAPGLGKLLMKGAGLTTERDAPRFAHQTLQDWAAGRAGTGPLRGTADDRPEVLLFADTFTNHFDSHIGQSAVRVLEAAGWRPRVTRQPFCCGRPLYDYGMVPTARRWLRRIVDGLRDDIRAGTPMVVLEPSCLATFRDELVELFPHDQDAKRLARQTRSFAELLTTCDPGLPDGLLRPPGPVLVHGHCHHKSVVGMDAETELLSTLGVEHQLLDSGCCGLAGSFGFEAGTKYEVSVAAGERVLAPAVRRAAPDTRLVADGFSCRTQVSHLTDRSGVHLAELLAAGLPQAFGAAPGG